MAIDKGAVRHALVPQREKAQAAGNWAEGGAYNADDGTNQDQINALPLLDRDPLFQNLAKGEAIKKRAGDFGYGTNNTDAANADIAQSEAIGQKYAGKFGDVGDQFSGIANSAEERSYDANNRGTNIYGADTGQYNKGLTSAADSRAKQGSSYDALMGFANQGPGPSAAQAQLTQATDANTQNALALARSGRGMGGSQAALRSAIGQNANTQQQSAAQMAQLRANENTAYQAQKLNALGAGGNLATGMAGTDQGYAREGLAGAQYQTDTKLKGTQLNDTTAQGWAGQQQGAVTGQQNAANAGLAAEMGAETQKQNINSTALTGRENEYASANTTNATEHGLAVQQGIADANRTQAYTGAAVSAAGSLLSDERKKTNVKPLSTWGTGDEDEDEGPSAASKIGGALSAAGDSLQNRARQKGKVLSTWGTGDDEDQKALVERAKRADPSKPPAVKDAAGGKFDPISQGSDMVRGEDSHYTFGDSGGMAESWLPRTRSTGPHTSINPENNPYLTLSDERSKQDLNPLGTPPTLAAPSMDIKGPQFDPISPIGTMGGPSDTKQPDGSVVAKPSNSGPSLAQQQDDKREQTGANVGGTTGKVAGSVAGSAVGGPVGGAIGSFFGGLIGKVAGKAIGKATSDVRAKREIQPIAEGAEISSPEAVDKYASASPAAIRKFARSDHPILSGGDSLLSDERSKQAQTPLGHDGGPLAESARQIPGYAYDYKRPDEPGAKPGRQVGPMAQDLAANPLTRGTVVKDRKGMLGVDTPRLTLYNTAAQHNQQGQLDELNGKIDELAGLLKRKAS
jgi:hypothetical protein